MMQTLVRVLIGGTGLVLFLLGVLVFFDPVRVSAQFGLMPEGAVGLGTVRGDYAGFFMLGGGYAFYGALRNARQWLLVPLILLGCALAGRGVTALLSGTDAQSLRYMGVEGFSVALLLLGRGLLKPPHRR